MSELEKHLEQLKKQKEALAKAYELLRAAGDPITPFVYQRLKAVEKDVAFYESMVKQQKEN